MSDIKFPEYKVNSALIKELANEPLNADLDDLVIEIPNQLSHGARFQTVPAPDDVTEDNYKDFLPDDTDHDFNTSEGKLTGSSQALYDASAGEHPTPQDSFEDKEGI